MGGVFYVNGKIVVFIYGVFINYEIWDICVEKVDMGIEGLYVMINYEYVNYIDE